MAEEKGPTLTERLQDIELVKKALGLAVRDALRRHKQAGNPIAVWQDDRVVWIDAKDIEVE